MNTPARRSEGPEIQLPDPEKAVVIVSGLPRSGTSMMMRMLEAGGIPVMVDNLREADDDNPRGYYEFEAVKKTKENPAWLDQASGKVVKMVYRLLYDLPPGYTYYIVFMRRNIDEVVASQSVMLQRHNPSHDTAADQQFKDLFEKELARVERWLADQANFHVLAVDYNQLLQQADLQIQAIQQFLGMNLDTDAMAGVVDPLLYRNRR